MKVIKTKRFILRPFRKSDEKAIAENLKHRLYSRNIPLIPHPYRLKDANEWMKKTLNEYKKRKPKEISFAIEIDKQLAGAITLAGIEDKHKAEIGYWLAKKYWGQGIIPEAVKLVTNFGFRELGLKRIHAKTLPHNKASMRVLKKSGFVFEGIAKKNRKIGSKIVDDHNFAKVK